MYMVVFRKNQQIGTSEVQMQTLLQKILLLGTNNPNKVKELRQLLSPLSERGGGGGGEIGIHIDVKETGNTYQENALLKAQTFSDASGLICLADDSGLEVGVLNGAPGLFSARFSPKPGANDRDRREILLEKCTDFPKPWKAKFRAVIAIALPDQSNFFAEGKCQGQIIAEERGENGFGYDPIFYIPSIGATMAELDDVQKNKISHRGLAINNAIPILKNIFTG